MRHMLPFQYIETIARMGSIRKAADTLSITPSALNRRLLSIERELGVDIFERVASGVRLSTAGEILLQHIRNQISDMERVKSRIADLSGMRRGNVSVAASAEFLTEFLPWQISRYRQEFPGVTFVVDQVARGLAEQALVDHSADIALIFEPLKLADFQVVCRLAQPLMCICDSDHPLAAGTDLRLYECAEFPVVLPGQESGVRALLEAAAVRLGLDLRATIQSNNPEFVRRCSRQPYQISFDIPINIPDDLAERNLVARAIDSRDIAGGFLFVGHLKGRALPVAAARFLEQIVADLSDRFD